MENSPFVSELAILPSYPSAFTAVEGPRRIFISRFLRGRQEVRGGIDEREDRSRVEGDKRVQEGSQGQGEEGRGGFFGVPVESRDRFGRRGTIGERQREVRLRAEFGEEKVQRFHAGRNDPLEFHDGRHGQQVVERSVQNRPRNRGADYRQVNNSNRDSLLRSLMIEKYRRLSYSDPERSKLSGTRGLLPGAFAPCILYHIAYYLRSIIVAVVPVTTSYLIRRNYRDVKPFGVTFDRSLCTAKAYHRDDSVGGRRTIAETPRNDAGNGDVVHGDELPLFIEIENNDEGEASDRDSAAEQSISGTD